MTKAPTSLAAVRTRSPLLLPALLLLAGLLFALAQFLVSDPGTDGGSGIGGTGRFGGESGLGGTGGPVKFGALDDSSEDEEQEALASLPVQEAPLASPRVEVDTLRLSPVKPAAIPLPAQPPLTASSTREELETTLAALDQASRSRAARELDALKTVEIDLSSERREFDSRVRRLIEDELDSTAHDVSVNSTEVIRELVLAQAALETAADIQAPLIIDVLGSEEDERRRPAVPVRPERPDRPSVPAQRFTPPQRGIPTPPVRPLRI